MPIAFVLILLFAWLISHGVYRAVVGTKCAFKGIDPPWIAARQEQLTKQEIRRSRRREVYSSPRTARGFIARMWGDLWEDANKAVDSLRNPDTSERDLDTPEAPGVKPAEIVPGDAGASWVHDLGAKAIAAADWARNAWDAWWAPSRKPCAWTYPGGEPCSKKASAKQRYCRKHRRDDASGHCLWADGNPDYDPCENPRENDFPFCTAHMDEWEHNVAEQDAAAAEQSNVGDLDTPDAPELDATGTAPASATDQAPRPVAVCGWGRNSCKGSPDYGKPACTDATQVGFYLCDPHMREYDAWVANQNRRQYAADQNTAEAQPASNTGAEAQPEAVTCRQTVDRVGAGFFQPCGRPVPAGAATPDCGEHDPAPQPEDPPQRPQLRIVPNANTQGDTNTMTAPSTSEITNVQALGTFAEKVQEHGNTEWPQMLESAESQMGAAGLTNDPALTAAIGRMREAAAMFAAAGSELETALVPHQSAAEQVSGLGNRAADRTATYQNQ